jgi:hypothetical protein
MFTLDILYTHHRGQIKNKLELINSIPELEWELELNDFELNWN